jgi:cytochrome c556
MKRSGDQARIGSQMVRGEAAFDPAKAQAVFATFEDKAAKLPALFPANTRTGDTRAAAAIWDKPTEWKSAIDKFGTDARAAKASTKDIESFKVGLSTVGRHCGTCHEAFRTPR